MSPVPFAGVVLAGGDSRRMGRPKAALDYRGRTFLACAVEALAGGGAAPIVVVAGRAREAIAAALPPAVAVTLLENPDPDRGQLSSLKIALPHLASRATPPAGVVVALVDHPAVAPETVAALVAAIRQGAPAVSIAVPSQAGRRGHPVAFAGCVLEELLATPDELGASAVVRRSPERVRTVEVADPGVLLDIDTPDDLARLRRD
jgi:molybdenum cofactor cytidylyltransferase